MHIALTISSSGDAKVYVNGKFRAGKYLSVPASNSSRNYCYLGRSNSSYFKGKLDEMRIWNTERSASNILAYINDTVPHTTANLKMYYKFDEGTGTVLNDSSINNYNGTLKNFDLTKAWISSYAIIQPIIKPVSKLSDTSFTINWNPVATALGYHLEYSVNQNFSAATSVDLGNVTSYKVTGLSPLNKYYYRINCSAVRTSNYSVANVTTLPQTMTIPGNALKFDGSDDYVDCGNNINLANSSFTIEYWAKRPILTNSSFVLGQSNGDQDIYFYFNNSTFFFSFNDSYVQANITLDTLWHHYAATFDKIRASYKLEINDTTLKTLYEASIN
jgi:hypothetical protein